MVAWGRVTRDHVLRAIKEYDRLGPERFFAENGFAPTTTYDLAWEERLYRKRDVTAASHYAAIACEPALVHFQGSSSSIFVLG